LESEENEDKSQNMHYKALRMKVSTPISEKDTAITSDELFDMANLYPRTTGLPMTVWVGPRGNARHDVRIKVNLTHGDQMNIDNTAVVGIRPAPHLVAGRLPSDDERLVFEWIRVNEATIIAYWDGSIDTAELIQNLKPIPPRP
jgi:hypothetical protein